VPEGVFDFSIKNLEGEDAADAEEIVTELREDPEQEEDITPGRSKLVNLDQDDPEGVLLPGLGTMMSDAVDWLSDERRSQFQIWKRDLIKQVGRAIAAA
jgi:hypothetical protein